MLLIILSILHYSHLIVKLLGRIVHMSEECEVIKEERSEFAILDVQVDPFNTLNFAYVDSRSYIIHSSCMTAPYDLKGSYNILRCTDSFEEFLVADRHAIASVDTRSPKEPKTIIQGEVLDILYIRENSEICVLDSQSLSIYDKRNPSTPLRYFDHYSSENPPNRLYLHSDKQTKILLAYSTKRPGSIFSFPTSTPHDQEEEPNLYNLLYQLNSSYQPRISNHYTKSLDSICNYNPCSSIKGVGFLPSIKSILHSDSWGGLYITLPNTRVEGLERASFGSNPVTLGAREKIYSYSTITTYEDSDLEEIVPFPGYYIYSARNKLEQILSYTPELDSFFPPVINKSYPTNTFSQTLLPDWDELNNVMVSENESIFSEDNID